MKTFVKPRAWPNQKWRWLLPILLVSLFVTILIWLPWQAQRMETNERQEQLIADTLWVEQTIQFQLGRDEEVLHQIGTDINAGKLSPAQALDRFRHIIKSNKEIKSIIWFDSKDQIVISTLEVGLPDKRSFIFEHTKSGPADVKLAVDAKTRCLPPLQGAGKSGMSTLSCQIPMIAENQRTGSLVVTYFLSGILDEMVPWWFAQDNEISLIDSDDKVFARRAAGGPGKNVYTHNRPLDLPNVTLILRTNSNKSEPKLLSNLLVLSVILLSFGLIWSLLALWRDINRRLAAEDALRQQVAFRTAMENSLVTGLRARDMEGRLTYVNPAFCKMVEHPAEDIVGRLPPMPYWAPEAFEEYRHRFTQLLAGTVPSEGFETIYQRASGERFPVLIYESRLVDENGVQTGWMSSILDISELKRAQELTRQQQEMLHASARLATMGEIASILAHELNQPLAAISSYTTGAINLLQSPQENNQDNLQKNSTTPDQTPLQSLLLSALEKANAQAQRAGHIIHSVHDFVKKRESSREPVSIAALLQSVMPLVELQAQASYVNIQYTIAEPLPMVQADRILLEQVILNLTRNAIEAMEHSPPERSILRIVARIEHGNDKPDVSTSDVTSHVTNHVTNNIINNVTLGHYIAVEVIDQGHGISAEVAAQLFSPFFSTKPSGMGMGLKICRTAIEFHGGVLSHHDNPAGGTIFRFLLPI
ncbi:PAS domain S-box protein [Undibacterium sp. RTI2.1]|uniref:two-component system sensor histidine kinase NtrB n=1 Tax=unclassified Undibacterium TaxID=2630295 RepID=UPI002B236E87|nr:MULTISPECIES: PAS domain S-box protein [unclassified Undibacterium]MEB0031366.1 PAS domain S-box protein [Undibacterium sp. RTI2.1]MEB0117659.1 PAS domain S-box protein [Undibacterium sp. RTI2.2]